MLVKVHRSLTDKILVKLPIGQLSGLFWFFDPLTYITSGGECHLDKISDYTSGYTACCEVIRAASPLTGV